MRRLGLSKLQQIESFGPARAKSFWPAVARRPSERTIAGATSPASCTLARSERFCEQRATFARCRLSTPMTITTTSMGTTMTRTATPGRSRGHTAYTGDGGARRQSGHTLCGESYRIMWHNHKPADLPDQICISCVHARNGTSAWPGPLLCVCLL